MARNLSRFADEPQMEPPDEYADEDGLDREGSENEEVGDDLDAMYHRLIEGDAHVARGAMALGRCFQELAHAAMQGNDKMVEHWYRHTRHVLDTIGDESEDDNG